MICPYTEEKHPQNYILEILVRTRSFTNITMKKKYTLQIGPGAVRLHAPRGSPLHVERARIYDFAGY